MCKAVQKEARHFLRSIGRWRHLSLWGPGGSEPVTLFTTWLSSCWCVRQVAHAGLLLGLPGLSGWLVRDMREELQEGHLDPGSPLLPASASALPFLFPFWLPVSPAPQCGNWIGQLPGPGLPFPHIDARPALRAHRATLCHCDLLLLFP